jgi:hypothetical protein
VTVVTGYLGCPVIAVTTVPPPLVAMPVPSGSVAHSTPAVHRYSGWPGNLETRLPEPGGREVVATTIRRRDGTVAPPWDAGVI